MKSDDFSLELVTGPSIEPLTLDEVKLHLRTYSTDTSEDDLLNALITSAREWSESFTGRVLIDQVWAMTVPNNNKDINIPKSPVIEIVSFVSVESDSDGAGVEVEIDPEYYSLVCGKAKFPKVKKFSTFPESEYQDYSLKIYFRAGYVDMSTSNLEDASNLPKKYKQAMKLWIEAMYDRDEKMMDRLIMAAESLLKQECVNLQLA
jgi:uncharacterized phiE125 gp8 family phage protein